MADLPWCEPYIDDFVYGATTIEELNRRDSIILKRLQQAKLTIAKDKCIFGVSEIDALGFKVSHNKVEPTDEYVQVLASFKLPANKTLLRKFLGKLAHIRNLYPSLPRLMKPLFRLLEKKR